MDLTRTIGYRGFPLNSVALDANRRLYGCEVQEVEYPGVQGAGYDEKRALADGYDASDVYLGKRLVGLKGAIYGRTRGEAWDLMQALIEAFTPTAAYDESPGDQGYLPLDFYVPTTNTVDFPDGYIHKQVLVRPSRQPSWTIRSDDHGGADAQPISMEWSVIVEAKDPRVYAFTSTDTAIADVGNGPFSGSFVNKGDYPSPLNMLIVVASCGVITPFHFVGGGSDLTINIPVSGSQQIIRYSAQKKVLTLESAGIEVPRMDILTFVANKTHPLVPVGTSAWQWSKTSNADLDTGGRFWHWDAWA